MPRAMATAEQTQLWGSAHQRAPTLVLFHYFELDEVYRDNLLHFLAFGWRESIDIVVMFAGACSVPLPDLPNIRHVQTENRNNDYGGICQFLARHRDEASAYRHVLFVNSSVRGPFLPPVLADADWTRPFTDRLDRGKTLVGMTINILPPGSFHAVRYGHKFGGREPYSHVQTMAYAMSGETLRSLCELGFFTDRPAMPKNDVIENYEIRMSQLILEAGGRLGCLLPEYDRLDYATLDRDINPTSHYGDVCHPHAYFGRAPHPFETLFAKTNREVAMVEYLDRLSFSAAQSRALRAEIAGHPPIADFLQRKAAGAQEMLPVRPSEVMLRPGDILDMAQGLLSEQPQFRPAFVEMFNGLPAA